MPFETNDIETIYTVTDLIIIQQNGKYDFIDARTPQFIEKSYTENTTPSLWGEADGT